MLESPMTSWRAAACLLLLSFLVSLPTWAQPDDLMAKRQARIEAKKLAEEAAAATAHLPSETVLALYDGGTVTLGEYRDWLRFTGRDDVPEQRAMQIAAIALNEVQARRARQAGIRIDEHLKVARLDFESRLLAEELKRHLSENIQLEPGELDRAVEERRERFVRPRRVRLRNLLKKVSAEASADDKATVQQQVEALRQAIVDGSDFAALAEKESDSQSRFRGGMIGWVYAGQMAPDIEAVALALKPGQLSPVLETDDGFTLLRCEEIEEEQRPPLEEIRQRIETNLRKEQFNVLWSELEAAAAATQVDFEAAAAPDSTGKIAKLADGTVLTAGGLDALMQSRSLRRPRLKMSEERRRDFVILFVGQVLAAQRAKELGLDKAMDIASIAHWWDLTTLARGLEVREIEKRFKPLKVEEIRAYYETHKDRYRRPSQTHLQAILLTADRSTLPERFREAEQLVDDLHEGRLEFPEAARQFSEHRSADQGGDIDWLSRKQIGGLSSNVVKAVEALKDGEISPLVQQPEGVTGDHSLWIVRRLATRPAKALSFEEVADAAENGLGNQRTRALQAEIRREALAGLNLRQPEGALTP